MKFYSASKSILFSFATLCAVNIAKSQGIECDMEAQYTHTGKQGSTSILSTNDGLPALFYRSNMDVNTDGAARSYHPDDPTGKSIAYNNMGNAITRAWNSAGKRIDCDGGKAENRTGACFKEYISAFEGARNNNYNPKKYPKIKTDNIIPWEMDTNLGWDLPCVSKSGPNKGFFISQTSQWLKSGPICDQATYVDSLTINAVVYPKETRWYSQGIYTDKGDLVVVRDKETGVIAYAIHGDAGPKDKIGEGSIRLNAALGGTSVVEDPTYADIKMLARPSVDYLVFPSHDVVRHYRNSGGTTQDRIDEFGKAIFEEWGGTARLDACVSEY